MSLCSRVGASISWFMPLSSSSTNPSQTYTWLFMLGIDNLHYHGCTQSSSKPPALSVSISRSSCGWTRSQLAFPEARTRRKGGNEKTSPSFPTWTETGETSLLRIREYTDKVLFLRRLRKLPSPACRDAWEFGSHSHHPDPWQWWVVSGLIHFSAEKDPSVGEVILNKVPNTG